MAAGSCCSTPSSLQVRRCLGLGLWLPGPYVRTGWMSVVDILVQKPSRPHLLPVLPVLRELRLGAWGRRAGTPAGVVALAQELVLLPGRWLVVGGRQCAVRTGPVSSSSYRIPKLFLFDALDPRSWNPSLPFSDCSRRALRVYCFLMGRWASAARPRFASPHELEGLFPQLEEARLVHRKSRPESGSRIACDSVRERSALPSMRGAFAT